MLIDCTSIDHEQSNERRRLVIQKQTPSCDVVKRLTSKKILSSSMYATVFPAHPQRPLPNTTSKSFSILLLLSNPSSPSSSHRSGRNIAASGPHNRSSRKAPKTQCPTFVPPGRKRPSIRSPAGGTTFSKRPVKGGCIRSPSRMQACR